MNKTLKREFPDPYAQNKLIRRIVKEEIAKELSRREADHRSRVSSMRTAMEDVPKPAIEQPAPVLDADTAGEIVNTFVDGGLTDWIEAQIRSIREEYKGEKIAVFAAGKIEGYEQVLNRLYSRAE